MTQLPAYIDLIAEGRVEVPTRAYPLSDISRAWTTAASGGPRVVIVPDGP